MKQETIEEAAENYNDDFQIKGGSKAPHIKNVHIMNHFIAGAKWQQERMYSEEDLRKAFNCAREFNSLDGVVDVHIVLPMGGDMSDLQPLHFTFEEWLKQFKKK